MICACLDLLFDFLFIASVEYLMHFVSPCINVHVFNFYPIVLLPDTSHSDSRGVMMIVLQFIVISPSNIRLISEYR